MIAKVFVSYSHQDQDALKQLQRFMDPLEKRKIIEYWDDNKLKGGDDWRKIIDQALEGATAAVLLISQDFMNSDFIYETEMPRILARADAGVLTVLPVFLSAALSLDFKYTDKMGVERVRRIDDKYQSYGTPDKPLLEYKQRETAFKKLSERLFELTDTPAEPPPEPPPRNISARPATHIVSYEPSREYQLTVQLQRQGDTLQTRYFLPSGLDIPGPERSWSSVEKAVEPICMGLDMTDEKAIMGALEQSAHNWGQILFEILFGPDPEWEQIMRTLFHKGDGSRPNPTYAPARLRIFTELPLLLGLPWRLAAWNNYRLAVTPGWELATTGVSVPEDSVLTTAPCNVLIVAARSGARENETDLDHTKAIIDVLQQVWSTRERDFVRVAHTRAELRHALGGMNPHLVYVYGKGTVTTDGPALLLDGDGCADPFSLTELARLLEPARPGLVYLNVAGFTEPGLTPGQIMAQVAPLVVWRRLSCRTPDRTSLAVAWLRRWLQKREDPVVTLHAVTRESGSAEAMTLAVHARYRVWNTQKPRQSNLQEAIAHLVLNRDEQKALVDKHLSELVGSDRRRVMALVAYAEPGNMIGSLHEQLQYYLDIKIADLAEINWRHLQFPLSRDNLRSDLEYELRLQLEAHHDEPNGHLIRRHAPRVAGFGKRGVLWLNWGVFGSAENCQALLDSVQLGDWLRFSSEVLSNQCPEDLRVVSYLAVELKNYQVLEEELDRQSWEPWCRLPSFWLSELPPLGKVTKRHLYHYLVDNSKCDPNIQEEIAGRLINETHGEFEKVADLIKEAQSGSWYDLLETLRSKQNARKKPKVAIAFE